MNLMRSKVSVSLVWWGMFMFRVEKRKEKEKKKKHAKPHV